MDLKIIYHNFRIGQVAIYGILTLVNFVVITYSLTDIKDKIPLGVYIPIIMIIVVLASIYVGKQFKKIQLGSDSNEVFKHSPELVKTLRLILEDPQTIQAQIIKQEWIDQLKEYEKK